jgi:hypothetical protein
MREHSAFSVACHACRRTVEIPDRSGSHPCPSCAQPLTVDWRVLTIPATSPPDRAASHAPGRAQCLRPPALIVAPGVK